MSAEAAARFATRPPSGAPFVAISVPGAVLPGADGALVGPRSGRLSPAFVGAAYSHSRQSPVVGTDGGPGPPECEVTSLARGRHPFSRFSSVLQERPSLEKVRGI